MPEYIEHMFKDITLDTESCAAMWNSGDDIIVS